MPVILTTDIIMFILTAIFVFLALRVRSDGYLRDAWRQIKMNKLAMISLAILTIYGVVALADSIRWRDQILNDNGEAVISESGKAIYSGEALTLLDRAFSGLRLSTEKTFSAPFADHQFVKENIEAPDGTNRRDYPALKYPGAHILGTGKVGNDVFFSAMKGVRTGIVIGAGATIISIPFAIFFGVLAGFYGGVIDDAIQYVYTTLSSIPDVLLIVSFMLLLRSERLSGRAH